MGKTYWMLVTTTENFKITRERGFESQGVEASQHRKTARFSPDDRLLYYLLDRRAFAATATVTSKQFDQRTRIWKHPLANEIFPHRVKVRPDLILDENQLISALEVGPRLDYVRKWPPEDWDLAFLGPLHILPQSDFSFIEAEMQRIVSRPKQSRSRRKRRNRRGRRAVTADGGQRQPTNGAPAAAAEGGDVNGGDGVQPTEPRTTGAPASEA